MMASTVSRMLLSCAIFFGALILALVFSMESAPTFFAILVFGLIFAVLLFFFPTIEERLKQSNRSRVRAGPVSFEWDLRKEPVRVVVPETPTTSTKSEEAKIQCDKGREIMSGKGESGDVDLIQARSCFERALALDVTYWEAQVNLATVTFLQGYPEEALKLATGVRRQFDDIPLAFAKSTLLVAKIHELRISETASEKAQMNGYKELAIMLEESLARCNDHLTTRISLGRVYLFAGADKDTLGNFVRESLEYEQFADKFRSALEAEGIREEFAKAFPDLYSRLN